MADMTGMTWRTIKSKLDAAGIEPIDRKGNAKIYESKVCLPVLYADGSTTDDLDLSAERARLAKEQADRVGMENAQTRGELVPVSALTVALARTSAQVAARLDGVPGRLRIRMRHWGPRDFEAIEEEIATARNLAADVQVDVDDLTSGPDETPAGD